MGRGGILNRPTVPTMRWTYAMPAPSAPPYRAAITSGVTQSRSSGRRSQKRPFATVHIHEAGCRLSMHRRLLSAGGAAMEQCRLNLLSHQFRCRRPRPCAWTDARIMDSGSCRRACETNARGHDAAIGDTSVMRPCASGSCRSGCRNTSRQATAAAPSFRLTKLGARHPPDQPEPGERQGSSTLTRSRTGGVQQRRGCRGLPHAET